MKHTLIQLPYSLDALDPIMSQETLEYHYNKHHKTYVDKLNELITWTQFEEMSLEDIIKNSSGWIFDIAAQIWNHNIFWTSFTYPSETSIPEEFLKISQLIHQNFWDFSTFKQQFKTEALSRFWSGWVWLMQKWDSLEIYSTPNWENPLTMEGNTLLGLDVWEHAYYIDYRNDRGKFVDNFWKIINWKIVSERIQ